ncbi:MAG TPA: RodZ domain-containing protein [Nitrospiraceae bacterium]|nr:RodZ domain-containing protein [Nitrospiraceae bacterium]
MESIGEFFKQVRDTKGLTLDDVALKTRIHPDFLIALEEGNFTKLPDQVFAKGFVRSYARSLGLDEEDAMRRFEGSAGAFYEKQAEREVLRLKQAEDDRRRKTNRKVVLAAIAVALLGLVLLMSREHTTAVPPRPATDVEPPPIKSPGEKPSSSSLDKTDSVVQNLEKERLAGVPTAAAVTLPPAAIPTVTAVPTVREEVVSTTSVRTDPLLGGPPSDGSLALAIEALELTWVVVQVDNGSPEEALMRPGERVQWKASDRFTLTLGNAGGVRVELNGKEQGPFGNSGKVARDIVLKR